MTRANGGTNDGEYTAAHCVVSAELGQGLFRCRELCLTRNKLKNSFAEKKRWHYSEHLRSERPTCRWYLSRLRGYAPNASTFRSVRYAGIAQPRMTFSLLQAKDGKMVLWGMLFRWQTIRR